MTAEDFIECNYHSIAGLEADKLIEDRTGKEVSFEEIAEAYHEHMVKLLGIANAKYEKNALHVFSVSARTYDPEYEEVDCDHYEYQQMPDDADEVCHLGIGIENCAHCYKNKALHKHS